MPPKLSAKQAEALRSASILTGVIPDWVHGRCLQALGRKALAKPFGGGRWMLTPEGRRAQEDILEREGYNHG